MGFEVWNEDVHKEPSQCKSLEKAAKIESENILMLDTEKGTAIFYGGTDDGEDYNVTLSHCDCQDFMYNKKGQAPCKHIYRLAIECGLIDLSAAPWATYINNTKTYDGITRKVKKLDIHRLSELKGYIDKNY